MVDLAQWLTACLDSDERIARRACEYAEASWRLDEDGETVLWWPPEPHVAAKEREHGLPVVSDRWRGQTIAPGGERIAPHIARHDPARVLREIDAKRKLVELHRPIPDPTPPFKDVDGFLCSVCTAGGAMYDQNRGVLFTDLTVFPCQTLRLLAAPYSDRPGFREEWAP